MNPKILPYLEQFQVRFRDYNHFCIKSSLATGMGLAGNPNVVLPNCSRASPATHVINVLNDVRTCLGLSSNTQVHPELSIFALRPDIVVVRHKMQIVLVVEVKSPGFDGGEVVCQSSAAGQVYDYAMALKQMGMKHHPFVCVSTYTHMRIGTVEPTSNDIFLSTLEKLEGPITNVEWTGKMNNQQEQMDIPCDGIGQFELVALESGGNERTGSSEPERKVHMSATFELNKMFEAFYFAVAYGVQAVELSSYKEVVFFPKEGQAIDQYVAVVQSNSLKWMKLQCQATFQLKPFCVLPTTKVYLLCVLGRGRSLALILLGICLLSSSILTINRKWNTMMKQRHMKSLKRFVYVTVRLKLGTDFIQTTKRTFLVASSLEFPV